MKLITIPPSSLIFEKCYHSYRVDVFDSIFSLLSPNISQHDLLQYLFLIILNVNEQLHIYFFFTLAYSNNSLTSRTRFRTEDL